jgi:hypothetical protein
MECVDSLPADPPHLGWLLWDRGIGDAIAAMAAGPSPNPIQSKGDAAAKDAVAQVGINHDEAQRDEAK